MNDQQLQQGKSIEESLRMGAKHKEKVEKYIALSAPENKNVPQLFCTYGNIESITLKNDFLPMRIDVLLKLYLSAIELEMNKLTKELEAL